MVVDDIDKREKKEKRKNTMGEILQFPMQGKSCRRIGIACSDLAKSEKEKYVFGYDYI